MGIGLCTGEIVVCVDADDYLLPGALAVYAARMQEPEVVKVQGFLRVVDARGVASGAQIPGRKPGEGDLASPRVRPQQLRLSANLGQRVAKIFSRYSRASAGV